MKSLEKNFLCEIHDVAVGLLMGLEENFAWFYVVFGDWNYAFQYANDEFIMERMKQNCLACFHSLAVGYTRVKTLGNLVENAKKMGLKMC